MHYIFQTFGDIFSMALVDTTKVLKINTLGSRATIFLAQLPAPYVRYHAISARELNSSAAELRFQRGRRALPYEGRISPCALRQLNIALCISQCL
jgi:hypothetical protein